MNTNKKELAIVKRAKKTLVGRTFCRLMGDETGAVMMEYVIVAVMIAAAVAVGAWFFGKDILNMFGAAGQAVTGNDDASQQIQAKARKDSADNNNDAVKNSWQKRQNAKNAGGNQEGIAAE